MISSKKQKKYEKLMASSSMYRVVCIITYQAKLLILLVLLATCYLLLATIQSHAFTMSNGNWIIQMGNLNSAAGKPSNSNFKLGVTVGENGRGLYTGTNYKVRAGFQYISSIIRFRFSISNLLIDFGTLTPTNPVKRTNTLTVTNGSANGYAVTANSSFRPQGYSYQIQRVTLGSAPKAPLPHGLIQVFLCMDLAIVVITSQAQIVVPSRLTIISSSLMIQKQRRHRLLCLVFWWAKIDRRK